MADLVPKPGARGRVEVYFFHGSEALAASAAAAWIEMLAALRGGDHHFSVALPGGRIAGRFFAAMVALTHGRSELVRPVHFFWGDERCVPPDDPESNFRLAREQLLKPLDIPAAHIHRIRGEILPDHAVIEAERDLRKVATREQRGQPVLDLVILGMGEDGHIASLFPNEPEAVRESEAVYRPVVGPKPPPRRVTLGYPALGAAREVWVLASGSGKEAALRNSLTDDPQTPFGRLLGLRHHTKILTDIPLKKSC